MVRVRKFKLIFLGLAICLSGYLTINYVNFKNVSSLSQIELALQDNSNNANDNRPVEGAIHPINPLQIEQQQKQQQHRQKIELKPGEGDAVRRLIAFDGGGFGSVNSGLVKCQIDSKSEVEISSSSSAKNVDLLYYNMNVPESFRSLQSGTKRQYTLVYGMESEVHSYGGQSWKNADFRMYYHLDKSFPEPATYFDVRVHLADLLSPARVAFEDKEASAPVVWVVSNCNAFNGRERFMKELMGKLQVHSYGGCLRNKANHPSEHMKGNIELFSKYKFVIAIENSNCEDYVTEKLVHAVASGSIPIVAGRDGKPDYKRFLPNNSFINIYDYKTVDELAKHINKIASERAEYAKYMPFKSGHQLTRKQLYGLGLKELIAKSKEIISPEESFFSELVAKEKSDNKLCKVASYLRRTPEDEVVRQIAARQSERDPPEVACLKAKNLQRDFEIKWTL